MARDYPSISAEEAEANPDVAFAIASLAMEPARKRFLDRDFRGALVELDELPDDIQQLPLWQEMHSYTDEIVRCEERGLSLEDADLEDADDDLHIFLVGDQFPTDRPDETWGLSEQKDWLERSLRIPFTR